jgi:hypothetical protein
MKEKLKGFRFKRWHLVAALALFLSIIVGTMCVALLICLPAVVEKNIRESSTLGEDSPLYDKWMYPKYSVQSNIWTYSVTNPDGVMNGSVPVVKAIGPYVYDQKFTRKVISHANNTIKYEVNKTYVFDEDNSCAECFPYNRIWVPNLIYQKFVEAASKPTMRGALPALIVQTPFLEIEVSELLFDGYKDPFLHKVCELPFVNFICDSILDLPDRIGFFYDKNGTSAGVFEINTGEADENDLGQLVSFNGRKDVPEQWWGTPWARMINGTDGNLFKPYISKEENLTVFVSDLCRSLDLVFQKEVDYAGVTAYRFVVPPDAFDSTRPENEGFCFNNGHRSFPQDSKGVMSLGR